MPTQPHSESVPTDAAMPRECSNVLCIDDDPDISAAIKRRLAQYQVDVTRAFFGMHGFWMAQTDKPDLIITDLVMPQGDGQFLLECLKSNTMTKEIPVIVLTGQRDEAMKRRALTLGAEAVFTKPVAFEVLIDAIRPHVKLQQQTLPADLELTP